MRLGRGQGGFTRRALPLLAALSMLVSFVLGGQRYFYCAEMNAVNLHACCEHTVEASSHDGPSLARNACCTMERFASLAPGVRPPRAEAPPAHPPAPVSVEASSNARPCVASREVTRPARGRPAPPDPREHRLRLMVFLT
jgi:hypothetical protein